VSVVHGLPSLHTTAVSPWHMPPPHASPVVHGVAVVAGVRVVREDAAEAGLHVSVVHALLSLHTTVVPLWHVPPPQTSPVVQALPSLHAPVLFVKTQPVVVLHVSVVQALLSLHTSALMPWQVPPPQVSPVVQAFPSLHAAVLFVNTQLPFAGLQASVVQTLLSLHVTAGVPVQTPATQTSPVVHALPSLHALVLFVKTQPDAGLHASLVQGFPSLQTVGT
jgi:hypothetical protein